MRLSFNETISYTAFMSWSEGLRVVEMGFSTSAFALATPETLVLAPEGRMNIAGLSVADGSLRWTIKRKGGPLNALYADGKLYMGISPNRNVCSVDPLTGDIIEDLGFAKQNCTRMTGNPSAFFCRGEGFLRYDRVAEKPFVDVGFQNAEGRFVTLDRHLQGVQHPLGRVEVGDQTLRDRDRLRGHAKRLRVQAEIDNQLLGRAGYAAEIGVARRCVRIIDVHLDLRRTLRLRCRCRCRTGTCGGRPFRGGSLYIILLGLVWCFGH